jgi:GAF domain-containing protein
MSNLTSSASARQTPATARRNTRRYALLGALCGLAFPAFAFSVTLAGARLPWSFHNIAAVHATQPLLWIIDTAPIFLGLFAALAGLRQDAVEAERAEGTRRALELGDIRNTLEQRVEERTHDLEQRDRQMRGVVLSTRQMAQARDSAELETTAVRLMAEYLPGFDVDLYLLDERGSEAIRTASSHPEHVTDSQPGFAVRVGDPGIVGQVAASGVAAHISSGPSAPEMALPLLARGRTLGVIHYYSPNSAAQLPAETQLLQLLADQLASALETTRLFDESRHALEQLQSLSAQATQAAWQEQASQSAVAYEYTPTGVRPAQPGSAAEDARSLRIPLELRGQKIGTVSLSRRGDEGWTDADRDLAQKTADQVALALDNVRLLEDTRERAQQELMLSEFSARLGRAVDLDSLLQMAVREIATLPEVAEASIYLNPSTQDNENRPS